MGWELRRQLSSPGRVCWSIVNGVDGFEWWMIRVGLRNVIDLETRVSGTLAPELAAMRLP